MSYEVCGDPRWSVRYSKGHEEERGEREERLVNIYDSVDPVVGGRAGPPTRDRAARSQEPYRAAALVLGVLGALLLVGFTVLTGLYVSAAPETTSLQSSPDTCSCRFLQTGGDQQETGEWKRFGSSCYYRSAEGKNWTDGRTDCQSRGADLVVISSREEQEFVSGLNEGGASWIGLSQINSWTGWTWVDGSAATYTAWKVGVNAVPVDKGYVRMGYIDPQGHWNHTENGSKRWICERRIL